MDKPNKKQTAILQLLNIINQEGLHYAIANYGIDEQLVAIENKKLNKLAAKFKKITLQLEEQMEEFKKEVEPFMDDDSDF